MRFSIPSSSSLVLAVLPHLIPALPFDARQPNAPIDRRKPERSYSVVNVDGGSTASSVSPTTIVRTVTATASAAPPSKEIQTVVSTLILTDSSPEETVVVTVTQNVPTANPAPPSPTPSTSLSNNSPPTSNTTPSSQSPQSPTETVPPSVSVTTISAVTVTIVSTLPAPSTSTQYYDDGMWHTYYPVKDPPAASAISSSPSASASPNVLPRSDTSGTGVGVKPDVEVVSWPMGSV